MRFAVEQQLAVPADLAARAFTDAELYERYQGLTKLGSPEVLERTELPDGRIRMRIRHRFVGHLSGAVRRVLDPERLTWVEEAEHDLEARVARFVLHPDHYADRLEAHGEYRIEPTPDGGCRRVGSVELRVRAPVVARAVEQAIASGLREHLAEEIPFVEAHATSA